jgi:hypothetical protein
VPGLPPRFAATASWWKIYLAVTALVTATASLGAGRRLGPTAALWTLPAGPVLGAGATWTLIRTRRGDVDAGLDPVAAATAREELNRNTLPKDPAVREAARYLLPGMIALHRTLDRRVLLPILAVAAVVLAVLAPVTGEWEFLVLSGAAVVFYLSVRVSLARTVRRLEGFRRELG